MGSMRKILLGLSITSGALLAAYLMTGDRSQRTKNYIVRRVKTLKDTLEVEKKKAFDDSEIHYI